jgi:uncharacterized sulfatase
MSNQPNFVIIFGETQGANVIGAYGYQGVHTPNIDRFAAESTLFTRGYTTCPLCTPSRAGLFSGIYPHTSGAWTNNLPFGDNIITMGQRFQDAGYSTAYTGKWHLDGHDYFGTGICPEGWDDRYWYDGKRYLDDLTDEEIYLWRKGLSSLDSLIANQITPEFTWGHRITNRAIDFLEKRDTTKPFLLVIAPDEPHHPFTCPPEYVEKFMDFHYDLGPGGFDNLDDKPAHQREWAGANFENVNNNGFCHHPQYFGCNSFIDHEYGRIFDAIENYAPSNTYVILTSDHGHLCGSHQLWGKGPVMYEEITRVPFIIRQPGSISSPIENSTPVSHIDLLPTMLEVAGLEIPPILEGQSLVPFLNGDVDQERNVIIEFNRYEIEHDSWGGFQPIRCIFNGRYKLVINLLSSDELYDLEVDPGEVCNLIANNGYAQIRDELHLELISWMNHNRDPFRGPAWERRSWSKSSHLQWTGLFRPRPSDGYAPEVRYYDSGMPSHGEKIEHGEE